LPSLTGTVPQFGGMQHTCSLKAKVFTLESWIRDYYHHHSALHAFGYNVEETKRVTKCLAADEKRMAFGFNVDEQKRVVRAQEYDSGVAFFVLP
jgi:hypothetical protein